MFECFCDFRDFEFESGDLCCVLSLVKMKISYQVEQNGLNLFLPLWIGVLSLRV